MVTGLVRCPVLFLRHTVPHLSCHFSPHFTQVPESEVVLFYGFVFWVFLPPKTVMVSFLPSLLKTLAVCQPWG